MVTGFIRINKVPKMSFIGLFNTLALRKKES